MAARVMLTRILLPREDRCVAGLLERPVAILSCRHWSSGGQCLVQSTHICLTHPVLLQWICRTIHNHALALVTEDLQHEHLVC